jgi:hypothetical protein
VELSVFSWGGVFPTRASAFDQARKTILGGLEPGNWKADKDSVATVEISLGGQQARRTARLLPRGFADPLHEFVAVGQSLDALLSEGVQEFPVLADFLPE